MDFIQGNQNIESFFGLLPADWQEAIVPYWMDYTDSSFLYILMENNEIIGGGLEFTKPSPEMLSHFQLAQSYFQKGYNYLGYIWINESHRGKGLGLFWLENLIKLKPNQKFWLSIEEYSLHSFYEKTYFKLVQHLRSDEGEEWIMIRE